MGAVDLLDMEQNPYEVLQLEKEYESSDADIKKVCSAHACMSAMAQRRTSQANADARWHRPIASWR